MSIHPTKLIVTQMFIIITPKDLQLLRFVASCINHDPRAINRPCVHYFVGRLTLRLSNHDLRNFSTLPTISDVNQESFSRKCTFTRKHYKHSYTRFHRRRLTTSYFGQRPLQRIATNAKVCCGV